MEKKNTNKKEKNKEKYIKKQIVDGGNSRPGIKQEKKKNITELEKMELLDHTHKKKRLQI